MNDRLKLAIAAGLIATIGLTACQKADQAESTQAAAPEPIEQPQLAVADEPAPVVLGSGIELDGFDTSIRPQEDFQNPQISHKFPHHEKEDLFPLLHLFLFLQ